MEFTELLGIVGSEPVFETGLLLAGDVNPADIQRQLSRWTAAGRLPSGLQQEVKQVEAIAARILTGALQ